MENQEAERTGAGVRPLRVGIGGIAIECATFSPLASTIENFTILRGEEMQAIYPFLAGWELEGAPGVQWLPCLRATSLPGGPVRADAYDKMKSELLERVRAVLPLDGFYFHIHGAMYVEGMEDAEVDLAVALREVVGPRCLISAGMDLHGNVSRRLVETLDLLTAYRTAPHVDTEETGERACRNLVYCLREGIRPLRAWVRIPVILPGERTSTRVDPARTIYARLAESEAKTGVIDAALWVGFVWADEPRSSAAVVVTGTDAAAIRREAETIAGRYWAARNDFTFDVPTGDADWCIEQGLARSHPAVIVSDSGDNPTAGGADDMTYFTSRLLAHPALASGSRSAIHASITAPEAVETCRKAGVGAPVSVSIGGVLDSRHGKAIDLDGVVHALVDGDPVGGTIAVVRSGGVHVILTSRRKAYHHISDFTVLGWDIARNDLTVVKIGYLEPELHEAARYALLALTPGAVDQDIPRLHYERVVRPIFPLDTTMDDPPLEAELFDT